LVECYDNLSKKKYYLTKHELNIIFYAFGTKQSILNFVKNF